MFPLSSEEENLSLGWLDIMFWSEFDTEIIPELQQGIPKLIIFTDAGTKYTIYEGDIYDLSMIQKYVRATHKDQD